MRLRHQVAQNAGRDLNSSPPSLFAGADHHADKSTKCQAQNLAFLSLGPSQILVTKGKARQRLIKVNDTQFLNSRVAFTSLF